MDTKKHRWILYLISITILITIIVQFYWNLKNYESNKQRITNEIQLSLDNSLEIYFLDKSRKSYFTIINPDNKNENLFKNIFNDKTTQKDRNKLTIESVNIISADTQNQQQHTNSRKLKPKVKNISIVSTSSNGKASKNLLLQNNINGVKIFKGKKATDSLKLIQDLQKIFIAIKNDTINHQKIDSLLKHQLHQKKIAINYSFKLYKNDTLYSSYKCLSVKDSQEINSKSTFLGNNKDFKMQYSNPSFNAFKRSSIGIILSSLLSLTIIYSLFYLLRIINKQKELAEIKNDLISNITHEFKTPITTVNTALEAIYNFNAIQDTEKTKKYLSISQQQIQKLNIMVEKLLETATLENEKLLLQKEEVNITNFIKKIIQKHQLIGTNKIISFSTINTNLKMKVDLFHFENAISNLIDNAIKYGGNKININLNIFLNKIVINVIDNCGNIEKNQQEKIFDQFYRIPKGNTHDIKGFGIGLFYTKKIIEKHAGEISVTSNKTTTTFKISLPYEY